MFLKIWDKEWDTLNVCSMIYPDVTTRKVKTILTNMGSKFSQMHNCGFSLYSLNYGASFLSHLEASERLLEGSL